MAPPQRSRKQVWAISEDGVVVEKVKTKPPSQLFPQEEAVSAALSIDGCFVPAVDSQSEDWERVNKVAGSPMASGTDGKSVDSVVLDFENLSVVRSERPQPVEKTTLGQLSLFQEDSSNSDGEKEAMRSAGKDTEGTIAIESESDGDVTDDEDLREDWEVSEENSLPLFVKLWNVLSVWVTPKTRIYLQSGSLDLPNSNEDTKKQEEGSARTEDPCPADSSAEFVQRYRMFCVIAKQQLQNLASKMLLENIMIARTLLGEFGRTFYLHKLPSGTTKEWEVVLLVLLLVLQKAPFGMKSGGLSVVRESRARDELQKLGVGPREVELLIDVFFENYAEELEEETLKQYIRDFEDANAQSTSRESGGNHTEKAISKNGLSGTRSGQCRRCRRQRPQCICDSAL